MVTAVQSDFREIVLSNSTFGPREISQLTQSIAEDYAQFGALRDSVAELETREDRSPAAAVRLGVCYFLLGRYRQAQESLTPTREQTRSRLPRH